MNHQTNTAIPEIRVDTRFRTKNIRFPGSLISKSNGKHVEFRPVDVSNRGLGFLVNVELPLGHYTLECGNFTFSVEVIYCNNHLGIDNLFRAGLFVRDGAVSLRTLFEDLDLIVTPLRMANPG